MTNGCNDLALEVISNGIELGINWTTQKEEPALFQAKFESDFITRQIECFKTPFLNTVTF